MDKIMEVVRHVITGIGAGLVAFGFADQDTVGQIVPNIEQVIGGVMALIGIGSGLYLKIKSRF